MKGHTMKRLLFPFLLAILFAAGCSTGPVQTPNQKIAYAASAAKAARDSAVQLVAIGKITVAEDRTIDTMANAVDVAIVQIHKNSAAGQNVTDNDLNALMALQAAVTAYVATKQVTK